MADAATIELALDGFVRRFAAEPRLKAMTAGWDRTIRVEATDLAEPFWLRVEGGVLSRLGDAPAAAPDMTLSADAELVRALFSGEVSPTEPYMTGDLRVIASEPDIMRLDVITLMIWGE